MLSIVFSTLFLSVAAYRTAFIVWLQRFRSCELSQNTRRDILRRNASQLGWYRPILTKAADQANFDQGFDDADFWALDWIDFQSA